MLTAAPVGLCEVQLETKIASNTKKNIFVSLNFMFLVILLPDLLAALPKICIQNVQINFFSTYEFINLCADCIKKKLTYNDAKNELKSARCFWI